MKIAAGVIALITLVALPVVAYRWVAAASTALPPEAADTLQLYKVIAAFNKAAGTQSLDAMLSLWADDAVLSVRDEQHVGKTRIREWFQYEAGPFHARHYWMALTPLHMVRIEIHGQRANVYFESHYVDAVTTAMKSQWASYAVLVRSDGRWLITDLKVVPASLLQ